MRGRSHWHLRVPKHGQRELFAASVAGDEPTTLLGVLDRKPGSAVPARRTAEEWAAVERELAEERESWDRPQPAGMPGPPRRTKWKAG